MTRQILLAACAAFALATPAVAEDSYFAFFGGLSSLDNPTFSGDVTPPGGPQTVDTDFDSGFGLGVAYGRGFGALGAAARLRGEIEFSFADSNVDSIAFSGNGPAAEINVGGDLRTSRLFGNLLVDFETGGAFTPYLGAGLGIAHTESDLVYGPGVRIDDSHTGLAAQLIAGASYRIDERWSLTGDVRYIRDFDVELDRLAPTGALTGVVEEDIDSHAVNIGLRYRF
ncbi:outer membrane protein [Jannaschia marina]|uniref:outer membrane protein n=1 Tax=Jannaschia marina TaxID=2741674 RepID=UPI0015CCAFB4|nr:outer membrane beta-barrel protein [Jannaschia marina]